MLFSIAVYRFTKKLQVMAKEVKQAIVKPRKGFNRQSNKITRAGDVFTLPERRVFLRLVEKFNQFELKDLEMTIFGKYHIEIRLDSIMSGENLVGKHAKKFVEDLMSRRITLVNLNEEDVGENGTWIDQLNIFSVIRIQKKGGVNFLQCEITQDVAAFFVNLQKNFTEYSLTCALELSSTYSQKLYELFCSWKSLKNNQGRKGVKSYSIDELKKLTQTDKKKYNTGMFIKRIIEEPIAEINDKTDIYVTFEVIKEGKSIIALEFTIKEKGNLTAHDKGILRLEEVAELPRNSQRAEIENLLIKHFSDLSPTYKKAILTDNAVATKFITVYEQCLHQSIKNPSAYLVNCLRAYVE